MMEEIRAYYIAPKLEKASSIPGKIEKMLPVGRIEKTRRGDRFNFVGRIRSADEMLEFLASRPNVGLYNEKDELCDAFRVAEEIRQLPSGFSRSGIHAAGTGAPYCDLSEWEPFIR